MSYVIIIIIVVEEERNGIETRQMFLRKSSAQQDTQIKVKVR